MNIKVSDNRLLTIFIYLRKVTVSLWSVWAIHQSDRCIFVYFKFGHVSLILPCLIIGYPVELLASSFAKRKWRWYTTLIRNLNILQEVARKVFNKLPLEVAHQNTYHGNKGGSCMHTLWEHKESQRDRDTSDLPIMSF